MKHKILIAMMLAGLWLTACGRLAGPAKAELPMPMPTAVAEYGMGGGPALSESFAAPEAPVAAPPMDLAPEPAAADRLVVRNADLSVVVKDVPAQVTAIQNMANALGGFVVSSSLYETYGRNGLPVPQAQVVIRVPQEKLATALEQIKAGAAEVQNESQSGQDVTDQYVDLQSRLKAKLAAEEQLTLIMQEARRTEDVLAVYMQLQQIQSEIEVLRGQIQYTEQSAALSSISVNIIAEETIEPIEVGGWKPEGVARDAVQSLIYFWQGFVDFLIRFSLFTLPVLITIAIPLGLLFLLVRWLLRRFRKPKAAAALTQAPKKK